eukprot:3467461-Rhodomonas_salina.1
MATGGGVWLPVAVRSASNTLGIDQRRPEPWPALGPAPRPSAPKTDPTPRPSTEFLRPPRRGCCCSTMSSADLERGDSRTRPAPSPPNDAKSTVISGSSCSPCAELSAAGRPGRIDITMSTMDLRRAPRCIDVDATTAPPST